MKLRQEVWVFLAVAVLLGWLFWSGMGSGVASRTRSRATTMELERIGAPSADVARPAADEQRRIQRTLFEPPSDTRPLPPLRFQEPPRGALLTLAAPPYPGPRARHFAPHLWRAPVAVEPTGLFDEAEAEFADVEDLEPEVVASGSEMPTPGPAERAALEEGYRRVFDWIELQPGRPIFGRIVNGDRYGLREVNRAAEAVRFEEMVPATGRSRYPGQGPVAFERERVLAFGFADTLENRLELAFRALDGNVSASNYADALAVAADCLDAAFEVPRALELAESLYNQCSAEQPDELEPRLGLARRHELAFELDRAMAEYEALATRFQHRAPLHVARAQLEARLLLDEAAEASFRAALERDSGYAPRLAFGQFLLSRGRTEEAAAVLEVAVRNAPQGPDAREARLDLRLALATALAAEGRLAEAFDQHVLALRGAPESGAALAGALALERFRAEGADTFERPAWLAGGADAGAPSLGFELLLATGAWFEAEGDAVAARDAYLRALDADPLRTPAPLRRLAQLAVDNGYEDQALGFLERALEADPYDAWSLYQRARLGLDRGDPDGAARDLAAALAVEADFADALALLGELAWRRADFQNGDLYLERALSLAPERADLLELRALCLVQIDAFLDARDLAEAALAAEPERFAARAVSAWCAYRVEGPEEALVRLGELEDSLRATSEDDARRSYTAAQIARVDEHRRMVAWRDEFERSTLANQWTQEDNVGPLVSLEDGQVLIEGAFSRAGETRLWREYPAEEFVSVELDLFFESSGSARVGVFLGRESARSGPRQIQAQVAIARNRDGATQARIVRGSTGADEWLDLSAAEFPADRWVRVRIERSGEGSDSSVGVALDGIPVLERVRVPGMGRASTPLRVGVFAEGDTGRPVRLLVDNVEVVRRLAR